MTSAVFSDPGSGLLSADLPCAITVTQMSGSPALSGRDFLHSLLGGEDLRCSERMFRNQVTHPVILLQAQEHGSGWNWKRFAVPPASQTVVFNLNLLSNTAEDFPRAVIM